MEGLLEAEFPFLGFIKRNQVPMIKEKEEKCGIRR
jgi:hypothetical protein